jgi:histidinol-phosphatase (PHP family)
LSFGEFRFLEEEMIEADFHVHTNFSTDSRTSPEAQIERAIELGFHTICITDHNDVQYPSRIVGPEYQLDAENYIKKIREMQAKYPGKIDVRLGVELGLQSQIAPEIKDFIKRHNVFDFVIGSSHLVHGKDPTQPSFWAGKTEQEGYRDYFESILENVKTFDEFSIYGHMDYVVRYSKSQSKSFNFDEFRPLFEEILRTIIGKGKGIEANTAGIRYIGYPHPCIEILKLYRELGGEIVTVGSDSHVPQYIGYGFDRAAELLKSVGFKYYTTFKDMKPKFWEL